MSFYQKPLRLTGAAFIFIPGTILGMTQKNQMI
jgi:hypothetical protein